MERMAILVAVLFEAVKGTSDFTFKCPTKEQWSLRASSFCNQTQLSYFCLLDRNTNKYKEQCRMNPSWDTKGYRRVFAGDLHGIKCAAENFQPFRFWTNGNSECVYIKSLCNGEGQLVHENGNTEVDRKCRCDYTQGYDYVIKPRRRCYCDPFEEDCTCYKRTCQMGQLLTPDYECRSTTDWKTSFRCKDLAAILPVTNAPIELLDDTSKDPKPTVSTQTAVIVLIVFICLIPLGIFLMAWTVNKTDTTHEVVTISMIKHKQQQLETWTKQFEKFVQTRASNRVLDCIIRNKCLIITGPPGCGKSVTAFYAVMKLVKSHDYDFLHVFDYDDIIRYAKAKGKQIILIDDILGKFSVNDHAKKWLESEHEHINFYLSRNNDMKILATCRSYTYNIVNSDVLRPIFSERICFMSGDTCLTLDELISVGKIYIGQESERLCHKDIMEYSFFPDLCATVGTMGNFGELTKPYRYMKNEIENLYKNVDASFLALSLFVILNNEIKEDFFHDKNINDNKLNYLSTEIKLSPPPSKLELRRYIIALKGSYVVETNCVFKIQSENLFDIITVCMSKYIMRSLLKYGKFAVFQNRSVLESLVGNESPPEYQSDIHISKEFENLYFDRLLMDIKSGLYFDVLCDKQNRKKEFRIRFIEYIKSLKDTNKLIECLPESTILHIVADKGYQEYMIYFAELDQSGVNRTNTDGRSPLHLAATNGHSLVTKELIIRGANINLLDPKGHSPLYLACTKGHIDTVSSLLSNKATIRPNVTSLMSSLHVVCNNGHIELANLLIENGANVNDLDKKDFAPLHLASKKGHTEICKLLIVHGATVNCTDAEGGTPLFHACKNNKLSVVKLLIAFKADPTIEAEDHKSVLHVTCEKGYKAITDELLKLSINVDVCNSYGQTPLFLACMNGHTDIIKSLLSKKSDVNLSTTNGNSPLHIASKHGYLDVISCLLDNNADANAVNEEHKTPLYFACENKHSDIVEKLMKRSALVNIADNLKQTPLHIARLNGNAAIVKLLSAYSKKL